MWLYCEFHPACYGLHTLHGLGYLLTLVPTINATTPQQLPLRGNPSLIQKVVTGAVNRQR